MIDRELLTYLEEYLTEERKQKFREILELRTNFFTVAIEDVYQLHNTSAVIRSCEVFGIQQAHITEARFGERLDKNIAMGAQKWVDVYRHVNTTECLNHLRNKGYKIVATSPHKSAFCLDDFRIDAPAALFFGTEKEGLSEEVLKEADAYLHIPMVGFTESLNISVSVAIILQHLTQKLRKSNISWKLTESEKLEKRMDWTKKSIKSIDQILRRYYTDKK